MATVAPSRLAVIQRLRCSLFATAYNPTALRTGAKYLRARLRGPSMVKYYPKFVEISEAKRRCKGVELVDEDEVQRLQDLADLRKRGKGAPKKAKSEGKC